MNINKIILFIFSLILSLHSSANNFKYKGFSGGMMLHLGYVKSPNFTISSPDGTSSNTYQINNLAKGIGGVVKFHFGTNKDQLRLGTGGFTSSTSYGEGSSYSSTSFAYLEFEYARAFKTVKPLIGLDIGGGLFKNHIIPYKEYDDLITDTSSAFRKYPYLGLSPYIGMEIVMSKKLSILCKLDYLLSLSPKKPDFTEGLRLYVGFVFGHGKS